MSKISDEKKNVYYSLSELHRTIFIMKSRKYTNYIVRYIHYIHVNNSWNVIGHIDHLKGDKNRSSISESYQNPFFHMCAAVLVWRTFIKTWQFSVHWLRLATRWGQPIWNDAWVEEAKSAVLLPKLLAISSVSFTHLMDSVAKTLCHSRQAPED